MEVFNLATREKQDEILSHFPISVETPWEEFSLQKYNTVNISNFPVGTYQKVFEIQGAGMLISTSAGNSSGSTLLRVFVDDILIVHSKSAISNPTGVNVDFFNGSKFSLPYIDTTNIINMVEVSLPIFFKSSLRVEVSRSGGSSSTMTADIKYHLK